MRLSKQQTREQEQVRQILAKRRLDEADVDFVYDHYLPADDVNTGKVGAFFTPRPVADEVSVWADVDGCRVLDLCAGIGALAYGLLCRRDPKQVVAVEREAAFVDIGRKLLPKVKWVQGDIFDEGVVKKLGKFDWVVANPPYGLRKVVAPWLKYQMASDLMAAEVALRLAPDAIFLLPQGSVPWRDSGIPFHQVVAEPPAHLRAFMQKHPDIEFGSCSVDMSVYATDWIDGARKVELVHLYRRET